MKTPTIPKGWIRVRAGLMRRSKDWSWTVDFDSRGPASYVKKFRPADSWDNNLIGKPIDKADFVIRRIAKKK